MNNHNSIITRAIVTYLYFSQSSIKRDARYASSVSIREHIGTDTSTDNVFCLPNKATVLPYMVLCDVMQRKMVVCIAHLVVHKNLSGEILHIYLQVLFYFWITLIFIYIQAFSRGMLSGYFFLKHNIFKGKCSPHFQ